MNSLSMIARRIAPQMARQVMPSSRFASTHAAPSEATHGLKERLQAIPVEAYPLVFLCLAMPTYGVVAGVNAVRHGSTTGYLRLFPERYHQEVPLKNVWED